jgi:hypothetical protein
MLVICQKVFLIPLAYCWGWSNRKWVQFSPLIGSICVGFTTMKQSRSLGAARTFMKKENIQ